MSFFKQPQVDDAIRRLLDADQLTILVGAGASAEAGLPTWPELVVRLLERVGRSRGLGDHERGYFCDWTLKAEGLMAAAAIVQASLEDEFKDAVGEELYRGLPDDLSPGPSHQAAARLKVLLRDHCELVTTNYDLLLSDALRVEANGSSFRAVTAVADGRPTTSEEALVRHLHGILTPRGYRRGDLVLSEGHYHAMQGSESTWQEPIMRQRLQHGLCLFVGSSLNDPNLLRYLYRTPTMADHVAFFTRQQEAGHWEIAAPVVREVREETATRRWEQLRVQPLLADYYTESAQFLWELVWHLEQGPGAERYASRLETWEAVVTRELMPRRAPARFRSKQDELHEHVAAELQRVRESLAQAGFVPQRGEKLGMHLWLHQPSRDALVLVGSSDRAWRDRDTLQPVPLQWTSPWAAVQAFCSGSLASHSTADQAVTRWNHVVGLPLFSEGSPWGRLPLGALTIASTRSAADSLLGRSMSTLRIIGSQLCRRTAPLLIPPDSGK